jgi:hypothetical protein
VSTSSSLADAKRLGEDVEQQLAEHVDALRLVPDDVVEWYDAVSVSLVDATDGVLFGGICLVESETPVEVKSARRTVSNGVGTTAGRWVFREQQHDRLREANAVYALTVTDRANDVLAVLFVPAGTVDEIVANHWSDVGRSTRLAKVSWNRILDDHDLDADGGDGR